MERPKDDKAGVPAERQAVNQAAQRTETERKRHREADVTAEREAPKPKTQRTEVEVGQGSGASGSAAAAAAGTLVPRRPQLADFLERKTMAAWDYDNAEIPTELDHRLVRDLLIKKLSDAGFSGPVEFCVSVGYWDSNVPDMDDIVVNYANECNRPTDRVTSGNQAADIDMSGNTIAWLNSLTEPQNVMFISGDNGFSRILDLLTNAGHLIILVTNNSERDSRAHFQWTLRDALGLPPDRVYKNPNEEREAAHKKERSRAHMKTLRASRRQAKKEELEKAETAPVPKSIVQLPDGSVQISIALENHKQKPVITRIDDECVTVVGVDDMGTNKEILQEIGRRIGQKSTLMQFEKVGDSNRWTLVVKDMTDRQAFLKLVEARK